MLKQLPDPSFGTCGYSVAFRMDRLRMTSSQQPIHLRRMIEVEYLVHHYHCYQQLILEESIFRFRSSVNNYKNCIGNANLLPHRRVSATELLYSTSLAKLICPSCCKDHATTHSLFLSASISIIVNGRWLSSFEVDGDHCSTQGT